MFYLRPITHVVLRGFYIEVRTIGIKIDLGFRGDRCSPKSPKGESVSGLICMSLITKFTYSIKHSKKHVVQ